MATIKEFLVDCYQGLTSRARGGASLRARVRQRCSDWPALGAAGVLLCRNREKPDQQSEYDERPNQRKQCMQWMKLKKRIARYAMPCRQHETLLRVCRDGNRQVVMNIVPLSSTGFQLFVTFPHVVEILPVNSANTRRSRRFKTCLDRRERREILRIAESDTLNPCDTNVESCLWDRPFSWPTRSPSSPDAPTVSGSLRLSNWRKPDTELSPPCATSAAVQNWTRRSYLQEFPITSMSAHST